MRFALVNNNKVEAITGLKGLCPFCSQPVIAKCGNIKVHHWAHKGNISCDKWWEPETEWHRSWKNNYPIEWQERYHINQQTGESHIADVLTDQNLVIEFQHSNIDLDELKSRESFYPNMIWVVNGSRLKNTYSRFKTSIRSYFYRKEPDIYHAVRIEECLPLQWTTCKVPVIFDFQCGDLFDNSIDDRKYLYCLLPERIGKCAVVIKITKSAFIKSTSNGEWQERLKHYLNKIRIEKAEDDSLKSKYKGFF